MCSHKLPSPRVAGHLTKEGLLDAYKKYPHLCPCPMARGAKGTWNWIERKHCQECPERTVE